MEKREKQRQFGLYGLFYAGQSIYNTYLNPYLSQVGFSKAEIGWLQAGTTLLLLLVQPLWARWADCSGKPSRVLTLLICGAAVSGICYALFPWISQSGWLIFSSCLFAVFFYPASALLDSSTAQSLKTGFGKVRLGGTIGYAFCALLVGQLKMLGNWMLFAGMAVLFLAAGYLARRMPTKPMQRETMAQSGNEIRGFWRKRPFFGLLLLNAAYYMSFSVFGQYYGIYYLEELGAQSSMLGFLSFAATISELPFFWYADRILKRWGFYRVMLFSGGCCAIRWFLLAKLASAPLAIAVNLLDGCGYLGFFCCAVTQIQQMAPRHGAARVQSFYTLTATVCSKILFAPISGMLGDWFGIPAALEIGGAIMLLGTLLFGFLAREDKSTKEF